MEFIELLWERFRHWLEPFVYLSNNVLSLAGVVVVTTTTVLWVAMLPMLVHGEMANPYTGILAFLVLPGAFFGGLALIPLGIFWNRRRQVRRGELPATMPALDFHNVRLRRLLLFVGLTTVANLVIAGQLTYGALHYMDGVTFCGRTCHVVMEPEYNAYQNSPHSRVECVKCHIGPGASWFVKSKLSGMHQVFAVLFNTYERPIPTPVHNLRPARETCEACHWPQKYGEDRLRIVQKYADDETNSMTKTVLLMRIGGGRYGGPGIHGAHLGEGVTIRYAHSDEKRQTIPWVESARNGKSAIFTAPGTPLDADKHFAVRVMDCVDCHNRPSHSYELPERAVDRDMAGGIVPPALPFAKKHSIDVLKANYTSNEEAAQRIPVEFARFYREKHPEVYRQRKAEIDRAGQALLAIYRRNVFPAMKVSWGLYPNNIGHADFPGCFRCHDDQHTAAGDRKIGQDCNTCHQLLAMEEPAPKILSDLGLDKK
ncbi:MAG: NapC/NirT family cytochrome c [Acidobacteria bacterium]|nr:NapC/NirT family cytochrome c [Acidobacteriota bacterium]